ncbi:ATP-binding cassette domain-containing protein [Vibrio chagasii]|nr:ATP-binding cassette domain-containing protein [Vibrio chagasii]
MMRAINDVSFKMYKAAAWLSLVSLVQATNHSKNDRKMYAPSGGTIEYKGRDIQDISAVKIRCITVKVCKMVWQDPFGSLNPTHNIFHHIARPLLIHKKDFGNKRELEERVYDLRTSWPNPTKRDAKKYPHQLSGGQRQRKPCT